MQAKTVEAILIVWCALAWRGDSCKNFTVNQSMLHKFNANIYDDDDCTDGENDGDVEVAFDALAETGTQEAV